ncbi:PqiC family protein [Variovorax sp. J22P168]|uniref:PqiC family protein n=1 Tax=Variovorax jilinensis TaxID=3053513 RepID=UPI0025773389|nr:PqiC family protein [Variovorax sp. J22P168]MDM0013257.1 PqiC family protein [Variovorax sp. J22P168]
MKTQRSRLAAPALLAALLLAAGCGSTRTQFYSLAGTATPPTVPPASASRAAPTFIELAPVAMPERFMRPQLVVRQKDAGAGPQVAILEQSRWSSSFENELRDALASGIAARLGAVDLTKSGRQRGQTAIRIGVQMGQFDAIEGRRVDAAFTWTLRRTDDGPAVGCALSLSEPVGAGIDALAEGAQRVASRLADAIAASVPSLQGQAVANCRA